MKLTGDLKALESSIRIYREALRFIIPIVDAHWDEIKNFKYIHQRMARIEKLIHSTKKNQAQYNFDERFPKLPTYLRRAALNCALGIVSSYRSNLANWEKEPKGQIPQLSLTHYTYPAYYKGNLFRNFDPIRQTIELKVFKNGDWVYEVYRLKTSDCTYYQNYLTGKKQNVPIIQKKGRRFYATFSYEENVPLIPEESIRKICAIDLGLGTDATCSIMDQDGTV
jgi:transposase